MPVFLLMVTGWFLHQVGWISDDFAKAMNSFVFRVPLPVLLFNQLATTDFVSTWDTGFVLFCFVVTLLSIALVSLCSLLIKDPAVRGEFVQSSYRSSAALLGIAYITNIYGRATMAPMMIIGAVPLYNVMAVIVLSLSTPDTQGLSGPVISRTLKGIVTNPIIIGIVLGFGWSILKLPLPEVFADALSSIGSMSTPMGLMAMGASVDIKSAMGSLKPALAASFFKLIGLEAIFLPVAVALGFRTEKLIAIAIMLGSATTVSSFVMARNMHHEGTLTSNTVVITTVMATFTLTFWIWLMRVHGWI